MILKRISEIITTWLYIFFLLALQPPLGVVFYSLLAGFSLLACEVSWSHTTTRHSRYDSAGRVISSSQRSLPDNTQHSQHTNIQALGGIRTHDRNRRAVLDRAATGTGTWLYITSDIQTTWGTLTGNHIQTWRLPETQSVLTTANTIQIREILGSPGGAAEEWRLLERLDTWPGKWWTTFRKHAVKKQWTSSRLRRRRYDRSKRR